jgi:hypothetical protein
MKKPSTRKAVSVRIVRSIISVVVGYLLFALSVFAFFLLSGQPPHRAAPPLVMLSSIMLGVVSACLGGYASGWLAQRRPLAHSVAVAVVLALGAIVSFSAQSDAVQSGPNWPLCSSWHQVQFWAAGCGNAKSDTPNNTTFTKSVRAKINAASIYFPMRSHSVGCGTQGRMRSAMQLMT